MATNQSPPGPSGRRLAILAGYFTVLMTATHLPAPVMPIGLEEGSDLWVHGAAYCILAALALWSLGAIVQPTFRHAAMFLGALAIIAACDELTQALVNRTPAWSDWAADCAGVLIAWVDRCMAGGTLARIWGPTRTPAPEPNGDDMDLSKLNVLQGRNVAVRVTDSLTIEILGGDGEVLFTSSKTDVPAVTLGDRSRLALHEAARVEAGAYDDGGFAGHRLDLSGFGDSDARLELVLAMDARDTLLVAVEQTGGADVRQVDHLYRFEKPVSDGGYMVLPHGSGYLIDADCPDELPGAFVSQQGDMIGGRWSMPLFGMARDDVGMCVVVEDWWDCKVTAHHEPGSASALDFNWAPSLGKLACRRQMKVHLGKGMDHTAMAKLYREQYARPRGLIRTLREKAEVTPTIERYIKTVLVRWPAWDPQLRDEILADLKRFREMGFEITLFYPKWPSKGFSPDRSTGNTVDGGWMGWVHPNPVPGGWAELKEFFDDVHGLGCLTQAFMNPGCHVPGEPTFDEGRIPIDEEGNKPGFAADFGYNYFCSFDDVERISGALDHVAGQGITFDALYYDGYSAHCGVREDFSSAHPLTRRRNFDAENQVMAYTREIGTMPGGELARFWCIRDCDFFFYSDWSQDRLTNVPTQESTRPVGEFVPLFQLVFHDCYMAGFSGGGHEAYVKGVDWWHDSTPRLYELMSCSAPCFNWLPSNSLPVADWDSDLAKAKFDWLKRRSTLFQAIATSEMTSHKFLGEGRKLQRIEFANGVWAEFDFEKNLCRVSGVEGFSGEWEKPCEYLGPYRPAPGSDLAKAEEEGTPEEDQPTAMFGQEL